jgi:DUF1680 family protein
VSQETADPWDGQVTVRLDQVGDQGAFTVSLRLPGWSRGAQVTLNGEAVGLVPASNGSAEGSAHGNAVAKLERGYLKIYRQWSQGDRIQLTLGMDPQLVEAHPNVAENRGLAAVTRGPLVYCAEETDNSDLSEVSLGASTRILAEFREDFFGGATILRTYDGSDTESVESDTSSRGIASPSATLVPYYAWDNRKPGRMQVWFPYREEPAEYLYATKPLHP